MARFLVTAALPYSNGRLHVGHLAGAYLPADIYVRYLRLAGHEVRFICGSDDNGVAALNSARKENRPVEELTADYRERQRASFQGLGVSFNAYFGTHAFDPVHPDRPDGEKIYELHNRFSQKFFTDIYHNDYFTKKTSQQLYDEVAQQFLPDRYVKGTCPVCGYKDASGDQCENHGGSLEPTQLIDPVSTLTGSRPVLRETVHWYLELGSLSPVLKRWLLSRTVRTGQTDEQLGANTEFGEEPTVEAAFEFPWRSLVINFAAGQVDEGLPARAMTRDLTWGVPVPLDDPDAAGKCLYVWFDAPIGYVSFTAVDCIRRGEGEDAYQKWWCDPECAVINFIGEDNIVFHAITWPAMLLATQGPADEIKDIRADNIPKGSYQLASVVCANAYLNFEMPTGEVVKQSKSKGTAVFLDEYLEHFDPDPLRYYLTSIAPEAARTAFSWDGFFQSNNSELVATLGNFVNRYQKILTEHFSREVPEYEPPIRANETDTFLAEAATAVKQVAVLIERFEFKRALERVMEFARACDKYITDRAPWNRVNPKKELPGKKIGEIDLNHAGETIYACVQATLTLGIAVTPFMPFTGEKIRLMLNVSPEKWTWARSGRPIAPRTRLGDAPLLFEKLDPAAAFGDQAT